MGVSVAALGDIDGDRFEDVVIGARLAGEGFPGKAYVIFGAATFPHPFDVVGLDGTNGFVVVGSDAGDQIGSSVAAVGDLNGDGLQDFAARASGDDAPHEIYVIFGRSPLELTVSGGCPGPVTVAVSGAEPLSEVWVARSDMRGGSEIAAGPCEGTELGLEGPSLLFQLPTDAAGQASVSGNAPDGACTQLLQAVDRTGCRRSAIRALPSAVEDSIALRR